MQQKQYKKRKHGNVVKVMVSLGLVVVLTMSILIASILIFIPKNEETVETEPTTTKTQSITFADKYIYFDLLSHTQLSNSDIGKLIIVIDSSDNAISDLSIKAQDSDIYRLNAPSNGYILGRNYTIRISDGISFADEALQGEQEIGFQINKDEIEKLQYKRDIFYLDEEDAYRIGDDEFYIEQTVKPNDILMVYDEINGQKQQIAVKVQKIESNCATVTTPAYEEIFDELDIFKTYEFPKDSIIFDENYIAEQALNIPQIQALSSGLKKTPRIDVKVENFWNPIKITIDAFFSKDGVGTSNPNNNAGIDFEFGVRIKLELNPKTNVNINGTDFNVSVVTESKVQLSAHFKAEASVKVKTKDWKKQLKEGGYNLDPGYTNSKGEKAYDRKDEGNPFSNGKPDTVGNSNDDYKHKNQYNKERIDNLQKTNAEKIQAINRLISLNRNEAKERNADIGIMQALVPLFPGIGVKLSVSLFFEASLRVELDVGTYVKINTEKGVRKQGGDVQAFFNITASVGVFAEVKGTLTIRAGIRVGLTLNLIGIIDIGIEADFGPYFEMQGSINAFIGPKANISAELGNEM